MPFSTRILFDAILEKILRSKSQTPIEYTITETDSEITVLVIEKNAAIVQQALEQALSSPEQFQQSLPYTLQTVSTAKASASTQSQPSEPLASDNSRQSSFRNSLLNLFGINTDQKPDINLTTVRKILFNLFGKDAFQEMALNLDDLLSGAELKDGVAYFTPAKQKKIATAWNASLEYLLLYFANSSLDAIRNAWEGNGALPRPNDQIDIADASQAIAKGLLQECFGTITQKNPTQVRIFFNIQKFYQLLYPPKISTATVTKPHYVTVVAITVNKAHFHDHVRMLAKHGVLFRLYKKGEKVLANPLLLAKDSLQKTDTNVVVILDCSGSMGDYDIYPKTKLQQAYENILSLVEKIKAYDEHANIRFVPFSSRILGIGTYAVKDTATIKEYLSYLKAADSTDLFGTINHELDHYTQQPELQQGNTIYFLYTDGQDTTSRHISFVDTKITEITTKTKLPKFISFGIGQDHDADTLNKLAKFTGSPYFHADNIADLGGLLNLHLGDTLKERALKQFIYQNSGETFEATLPLTKGDVIATDLRIEIPHLGEVAITYDGQQLQLSALNTDAVPAANPYDQLLDYARDARGIVQDEKLSYLSAQEQLNKLLSQVRQLHLNAGEKSEQYKISAEIKQYLESFKQGHDYAVKSARSLAATRSGIMATQTVPSTAHAMPLEYTCNTADGSCQANSPTPPAVSQQKASHNPAPTMRKLQSFDTDEAPSTAFIPVKSQTSGSHDIHSHWVLWPLFRLLMQGKESLFQSATLLLQQQVIEQPTPQITALAVTQAFANQVRGTCTVTDTPSPFPYDKNYVFQLNCTAEKRWIGKLSLYGNVIPCSLDDGNNILRIDGVAGFLTAILKTAQGEVCTSLPPSAWQICKQETVSSSLSGAGMGTLRGFENIATHSMTQRYGFGSFAAKAIAKVGTYGVYFSVSFYCNVDTQKPETTDAERYAKYAEAAYKAGISTVVLAASEIGSFAIQQTCRLSSDKVRAAGYPRTATWLQRVGSAVTKAPLAIQALRAPVTAFFRPEAGVSIASAVTASVPATTAALVAGTVCEQTVTAIGKRLLKP